ncbi:MAG: MBL fold metallo-hydrolase [Patescibacteria group bacterium]
MFLSFYGAAREVTGSCNLLETAGHKILIDCGMFQGGEFNEQKNFEQFEFNPKELSAVVVTHAHLDHVGRLPSLIKNGYEGFFYATPATIELASLIMEDALEVMVHNGIKTGALPLYGPEDIAGVMQQFKAVDYGEEFLLNDKANILLKFYDAGHIFGSAFVEINSEGKKIVFSGDIGNEGAPIVRDTENLPADADVLICESTYGDREHESPEERKKIIKNMIAEAVGIGGAVMIPSFSLERTQELLYELNELIDRQKRIPRAPIFLDSPLAIAATKVYRKYTEYYDKDAERLLRAGDDLFQFPGLTMCETREESKRINQVLGPKIIIAGAGMMNGGRIVHHALRYLSDERSSLLIIGYQAVGTLGRKILDGAEEVEIKGERVKVRCRVRAIGAMSAHGDRKKLLKWINSGGSLPKKVYVNHGEPDASEELAKSIKKDLGVKATVVNRGLRVKI